MFLFVAGLRIKESRLLFLNQNPNVRYGFLLNNQNVCCNSNTIFTLFFSRSEYIYMASHLLLSAMPSLYFMCVPPSR